MSGKPKKLARAHVTKMLKAKGFQASPHGVEQLTKMMKDDLEREAQTKAVDRFMDQFWAPVRKKQRKP